MTAPRWQDARDHALKLLREERTSLVAELPRIESVDERELFDAWLARVDLALATIGRIDDAALARLAEPEPRERFRAAVAEIGELPTSVLAVPAMPTDATDEAAVDALMRRATEDATPRPITREPSQPSAAERWRKVPGHDRDDLLDWLDGVHRSGMRGESLSPTAHVAVRALLALAREAEGGGR